MDLFLNKPKHLLRHTVLKLLTPMLGKLPTVIQAHHHQLRQIAAAHVVALVHRFDHLVITVEEFGFFAQFHFQCAAGHLQGEFDATGRIPVAIDRGGGR